MPENPTSTTTTSVIVPAPHPQPTRSYDEWGVANIFMLAVVGIITVIGSVVGIFQGVSGYLASRRASAREEAAPFENRLKALEDANREFRSVDYLDKEFHRLEEKLEHHKNNTNMKIEGVDSRVSTLSHSVAAVERSHTRLETQIESMQQSNVRLEGMIERMGERFDERFDRLQEMVSKPK